MNSPKRIILISFAAGVLTAVVIFFVIANIKDERQNGVEERTELPDADVEFLEQAGEQADPEDQESMVEIWYKSEESGMDLPDERLETGIVSAFRDAVDYKLNPDEDLNNNSIPDKWEEQFSLTEEDAFSDEDDDGFSLMQEYMFKTNPVDPLSHPKYINLISSRIVRQRISGLELVSVDMTKPDKKDWIAKINVLRNSSRRSESVCIGGTFKHNNVDFYLIDIELDGKTQKPVVYVRRGGKEERIPCHLRQTVYDPNWRIRLSNNRFDMSTTTYNRTFTTSVGSTFLLGSAETGEERYKVVSFDPDTQSVVVESTGSAPEKITILPEPLIPTLEKDSDWDKDGFTLAEEFAARTDPSDSLSHPKYITRIGVFSVNGQDVRFIDGMQHRVFTVSVRSIFHLGTVTTGREGYKVISINPDRKTVVVESTDGALENITIQPVPLISALNKDSDHDADGFTLAEEYEAQTDPFDPLSHPKYITRTIASHIVKLRIDGLELVSVDTSKPDKNDWIASFNVLQNNKKRSRFVKINNRFESNNRDLDQYDFTLVDIEMDEKTGNPVAYIRHCDETELIACRIKQPVHYLPRLRLIDPVLNSTIDTQVGSIFKLGTDKTGEEEYRVVSVDPVVVESAEAPHDFSTVVPTSTSDEDSDGFVLEEELMAHTDPGNPLSHPKYIRNLYIFSAWDLSSSSIRDERYDISFFDPIQGRILKFKSDVEIGSTFKLGSARTGEETYRIDRVNLKNFFSYEDEVRVKSVKNKDEVFLLHFEPENPRWRKWDFTKR